MIATLPPPIIVAHATGIAGASVRAANASREAPRCLSDRVPRGAYTPGTPPGTWTASALPVPFALAGPLPRDLGVRAELEVLLALRSWPEVTCTAFRASYAGTLASAAPADDGVNEIIWDETAWPDYLTPGALAQTVVNLDVSGNIHDADIHLNGKDYRWSFDGAPGTIDARGVLTHELGHALGLGHSLDPTATMYASRSDTIAWRSLENDDRAGVCALYPGTGAPRCDEEGGRPCPAGAVCVAHVCEAFGDRSEVCSPCAREPGACAGAGDDARCIDLPGAGSTSDDGSAEVCGRACSIDGDCGANFHCVATTSSGDLQCVADDDCAHGPFPCQTDGDCAALTITLAPLAVSCRANACVAVTPAANDDGGTPVRGPDASTNDTEMTASASGAGCACTINDRVDEAATAGYEVGAMILLLLLGRRRRVLALSSLALSGCAGASSSTAPVSTTAPRDAASDGVDGGPAAAMGACSHTVRRIECVGARHLREGATTWLFDVKLQNPSNEARWLVFPEMFARDGKETPFPGRGPILDFTADLVAGRGRVLALHATGEGGFRAIELPPHGEVMLTQLPVNAVWNSRHKTGKLEVIVARRITIDDDPVTAIVQGELLSDGDDPDVRFDTDLRDRLPLTRFFGTPRVGKPALHPVVIDEECRSSGQAVLKDEEP